METLLRNDFTTHYGLPVVNNINIAQTNASYFELKDDAVIIYTNIGQGVAKFDNNSNTEIAVINYENYINTLPHDFQEGRKKCDLLVYSINKRYFLLSELTDTKPQYIEPYTNTKGNNPGKKATAIVQLSKTLIDLTDVLSIRNAINNFTIKRCCFFNKQSNSPSPVNATSAFNRLHTISRNGLQMSNPTIEALGFELYEYSGNQVFVLT